MCNGKLQTDSMRKTCNKQVAQKASWQQYILKKKWKFYLIVAVELKPNEATGWESEQ